LRYQSTVWVHQKPKSAWHLSSKNPVANPCCCKRIAAEQLHLHVGLLLRIEVHLMLPN